MKVAYKIGIKREFLDRVITVVIVNGYRIPSNESRAVRIVEIICSADFNSELLEH